MRIFLIFITLLLNIQTNASAVASSFQCADINSDQNLSAIIDLQNKTVDFLVGEEISVLSLVNQIKFGNPEQSYYIFEGALANSKSRLQISFDLKNLTIQTLEILERGFSRSLGQSFCQQL